MSIQHCFGDNGRRDGAIRSRSAAEPSVERILRSVVVLGALLVIAVPAARGHSQWFGALPLWLVGMPLASWWGLHRFRLPLRWGRAVRQAASLRRGARGPQARRRTPAPRLRERGVARAA